LNGGSLRALFWVLAMIPDQRAWILLLYRDHAIHNGNFAQRHPPTEGISLSDLGPISQAAYFHEELMKRTENISVWRDLEGEDDTASECVTLTYGDRTRLQIRADGDASTKDHDYVAKVSVRDRYRTYRDVPMRVGSVVAERSGHDAEDWLRDEINRLKALFASIDAVSNDLLLWKESGHSMLLRCRGGCHMTSPAIISPEQIANFVAKGLSMVDVRKRLVCKKCKKRDFFMVPK